MAWTAPATWVAGTVVTAADLNAQVRDNELILKGAVDNSGVLTYGASHSITSSQGLVASDKVVLCSNTITVSLLASATNAGKFVYVKNVGVGTVTVNVSGGGSNIDSAGSVNLAANDAKTFYCDGTQWWILGSK